MKQHLSLLLRRFGLSYAADFAWFCVQYSKNFKANRQFRREQPDIALPPAYTVFESFQASYRDYWEGGKETARWIADLVQPYLATLRRAEKPLSILDWGCGPARVVRHLPQVFPEGTHFAGSDYNAKTIEWNRAYIANVEFRLNSLMPPLDFPSEHFDVIYSLSVLTHLSEEAHYLWVDELWRVLRPGGICLITTQGRNHRVKLTADEKRQFDSSHIVVRSTQVEGHRTYAAFHPTSYMEDLFAKFQVELHLEREPQGAWLPQDVWIVRKPAA